MGCHAIVNGVVNRRDVASDVQHVVSDVGMDVVHHDMVRCCGHASERGRSLAWTMRQDTWLGQATHLHGHMGTH